MKITKVAVLPEVLEPSSIYLVKESAGSTIRIYATDETGASAFTSDTTGFSYELFVNYLNQELADNNVIATVDALGFLKSSIKLHGQDAQILGPTGEPVWKDNVSFFSVKGTTGGNNPSFEVAIGNIQGLVFHPSTMNQVWCDFHIDHDIALNTKIYPHVHYMPTDNAAGTVRWGVEYYIAKGHQQQKFQGPTTIYIEQAIPANSFGLHMVAEATDAAAILSANVEPDSFIKTRIFRDANHANDTYTNYVHAWCADLHYQVIRVGTKNKGPNFFI